MKEFIGALKKIQPSSVLDPNENKDIDSFFLVLSLVYNDLKDFLTIDKMIRETYRVPEKQELSVHSGEYAGLRAHIHRLIISVVSEFLIFLDKNKNTLNSSEFKKIENKLTGEQKIQWDYILSSSSIATKKNNNFLKNIIQIRSNVVSHFDHSMKNIKASFESFFFQNPLPPFSNEACFSLGNSMSETRFFYTDAAVQRYVLEKLGININASESSEELDNLVSGINQIIIFFIREHLNKKNS